ncbi:kinetochore protein Spc24 isoform X2 [Sagmatias obliquidens]|uniref:Kinetochore protein Spc24 n=1 Tax=Tursiops truncatus TaxID=9739 RepID=A0A6J3R6F7_TURTR|nr:kinetochore protein Spc24 isoform X2 [Lagenorhynchus obliquidens]XP_030735630.1 kinetochore protein Spc24 isoform X2 [Globicephala melas]XP_033710162.1 kinetochore protein Spc24 isoform X2 [Tursiops truncatus]
MAAFRDMEEVSQGLLSLLGANRAEAQQRRLLRRHEQVVERLLETQDGAEQRLRESTPGASSPGPDGVGVSTWAALPPKPGVLNCLCTQLSRELEELKEIETDLERQEREVDEDTTVTIPSAVYVAQLYRRISKIEWDYECEPGMIKGIHHGPSVAQPIHLDSTQLSKKFISDYLWSLVDTEW